MSKLKIALVDDHALLLAGLKMLISAQEDMEVVAEAGGAKDALVIIPSTLPDCILLDISLPDISGMDLLPFLKEQLPNTYVIMLTMYEDSEYLNRSMEMGASGFLMKKAMDQDLLYAIRTVSSGGVYIQPDMLKHIMDDKKRHKTITPQDKDRTQWDTLSSREQEVMLHIAQGFSAREIADRCNLSEKTIATYRSRGFLKLGISKRSELVAFVLRAELLSK